MFKASVPKTPMKEAKCLSGLLRRPGILDRTIWGAKVAASAQQQTVGAPRGG